MDPLRLTATTLVRSGSQKLRTPSPAPNPFQIGSEVFDSVAASNASDNGPCANLRAQSSIEGKESITTVSPMPTAILSQSNRRPPPPPITIPPPPRASHSHPNLHEIAPWEAFDAPPGKDELEGPDEGSTAARNLFLFGFLFFPFWVVGACIIFSDLKPVPGLEDRLGSLEERGEKLQTFRRAEIIWAWRCLWALLATTVVVALIVVLVATHVI